jgi:type I restriction enzyme M protein
MKDKTPDFIKRNTILESVDFHIDRNLYCERKSLTNEASVENFFVNRLLSDFGFQDRHIKTKESIEKLTVAKGRKKFKYKPDYCLVVRKTPRLIIDAKPPEEDVYDWVEQCAHYCLLLNRRRPESVDYFLLTNGLKTVLYKWDQEEPLLELDFEDFYIGSRKYEELRNLISFPALSAPQKYEEQEKLITLKKINKEDAQKLFLSCHKYIWSTEKRGPYSAFTEFVKLVFLKLWNDRILHENYPPRDYSDLKVPISANTFSVRWIQSREKELINPVNDIQFKNLLEHIQDDIDRKNKKRIFDTGETIKLRPSTIKGVVKKLERVDLFGIDEDLNGRLFETFLNSTMRGQALGQYFTPRSIVMLGTRLADLQASKNHIDKILDASCGTGGFLIEAMSIMRNIFRENKSYSRDEKIELINKISNECIYGIDAASEPNLARIARINMYLHGDGGSHIYFADGLEKTIEIDKSDSRELQLEIQDLKKHLKPDSFNVVLTNPPFSMWYEMTNETQAKVLKEYNLVKVEGTTKTRNRLRGSAMFIERYHDLLKPGGKLISIIDETVLSSEQYAYVRDYIRSNFIIRAVISLHGDAFQMAKSRVKTSLIYLEKKKNTHDQQPAVFMYFLTCLGVDDMPLTTNPAKVKEARELASSETSEIVNQFNRFKNGEEDIWLVTSDRLADRLDVKSCIPLQGRFIKKWQNKGYEVKPLHRVCDLREEILFPKDHPNTAFRILTITYSGRCKTEETRLGKNINYKKMKVLRTGDLVFSDYDTFNGAIGFITDEFDGALASGSYTVVKCFNEHDSLYLWSILRTTEMRADFLTSAIGMGRQTVSWEDIKNVEVPFLPIEERQRISDSIRNAWQQEKLALQRLDTIAAKLHDQFNVESEESKKRFEATKPPR